jgi:hypothetical protein
MNIMQLTREKISVPLLPIHLPQEVFALEMARQVLRNIASRCFGICAPCNVGGNQTIRTCSGDQPF